jgi:hypothetical protein
MPKEYTTSTMPASGAKPQARDLFGDPVPVSALELVEGFPQYVKDKGAPASFSEYRVTQGWGEIPLSNRVGANVRRVALAHGLYPLGTTTAEAPLSHGRLTQLWIDGKLLRRLLAERRGIPAPTAAKATKPKRRTTRRAGGA